MTKSEFIGLCNLYSIDPAIALENEAVVEAIQDNNIMLLNEILETQF